MSQNASFHRTASNASQNANNDFPSANLKIIKTDVAPTGEAIQLVRPIATDPGKSTDEIVAELVNRFDYKQNNVVIGNEKDLTAIEQAFGSNLANKLLQTYDGSAVQADTQQDLIGEKYLSEQIKRIQETKKSVIDRYAHLLYEGDANSSVNGSKPANDTSITYSNSFTTNVQPIQQQEFSLSQTKLQPAPSSKNITPSASGQLRQSSSTQASLQEQLRRLAEQEQREREQQERIHQQLLEQEKALQEAIRQEQARIEQERLRQQRAEQEQFRQQEIIRQEMEALLLQQQQAQAAAAAAMASASQTQLNKASSQVLAQDAAINQSSSFINQQRQQSNANIPNAQSSSHLKSVTIDAYNDPQFKAMLDQITKPLNVPIENIELQGTWPSADQIEHLADPIIIPAPEPIVIPAPDIIKYNESYASIIPQSVFKSQVTLYPKTDDSRFFQNFDINQLDLNGLISH